MTPREEYGPFFDQEEPELPIRGLIDSMDNSGSYELNACGVFDTTNHKFLVVFVSGCSCWPDRGSTDQIVCDRIVDVDRALANTEFSGLKDKCQQSGWDSREYGVADNGDGTRLGFN